MEYKVVEVILEEPMFGVNYKNLSSIEKTINDHAKQGYTPQFMNTVQALMSGKDKVHVILTFKK